MKKVDIKGGFLKLGVLVCCILAVVLTVNTSSNIDKDLTDSAYVNLRQSLDQLETTITASWNQDAAGLKEIASILSNVEEPKSVLSDIERNKSVYRYLFVDLKQVEGVASDGTTLQKNDEHVFTPNALTEGVETSEAFFGSMGEWTYLSRCPVYKDGELIGAIYAQFLFNKLDAVIPDEIYQGSGYCYIFDTTIDKLVYQNSSSRSISCLGDDIQKFLTDNSIRGIDEETILSSISAGDENMFHVKENGENMLIYVLPMKNGPFYLLGLVNESSILSEADTVRGSIIFVVITLAAVLAIIVFVILLVIRRMNNARVEREKEREEYNAQLEIALSEAETANEAKSNFLANMSHEIRTPMNAVLGMADLAMREDMSPDAREYIHQIKNSGKNLLVIINDILDFSKIESGKMDIIEVSYESLSLLNDLANIVNTRIGGKDVEFIMDIDPTVPHILYGDNIRLQQILINLLNNAVKFTQHGQVKLSMNCEFADDDTVIIHADVSDTGVGIKEEDLGKLFRSFQQLDSKRNRNIEGTGLGLAICSKLLELMHGSISVSSVYNEGTTFSITIPQKIEKRSDEIRRYSDKTCAVLINNPYVRAQIIKDTERAEIVCTAINDINELVNETPDYIITDNAAMLGVLKGYLILNQKTMGIVLVPYNSPEKSSMDNMRIMRKPLYSFTLLAAMGCLKEYRNEHENETSEFTFVAPDARILIVDDTPVNLTVASGLLKPLQMKIDTATGAERAIELVKEKQYDMIFMDHMMPGIDGIEASHMIRELGNAYKTLPIIALTANAIGDAKEMFLSEGLNDFVAKPIELKDITAVIRKWLSEEKIKPVDMADYVTETTSSVNTDDSAVGFDALSVLIPQFDMKTAMNYCCESEDLLKEIIAEYVSNDCIAALEESLENGDFANYRISIHSLKSTSLTVGLVALSEKAKASEFAIKDGNNEYAKEHHNEVMNEYKDILEKLKMWLSSNPVS